MAVNLYVVRDSGALLAEDAAAAGLSLVAQGMVARSPSQLPPSQEEHFRHGLSLLQRFAEREGHAYQTGIGSSRRADVPNSQARHKRLPFTSD
jgi:hypothetical protein